jgi:SnoaL-like protein
MATSQDPVDQLLHDPRFKGAPVTWDVTPEEYAAVRHAWLTHVSAEERLFTPFDEDEFQQQMAVMLSVFSDDCVMELVSTGDRWVGQDQAQAFYRVFLGSFDDMKWVPQALVIGPQGVLDIVNMTGTLKQPFAGFADVGQPVHQQWVIHFPWIPEEQKFRGESIFSITPLPPA